MRVGGLASGIDTEQIIKELMNAERIPLNKLEQQKTKMEWQRDAFRDINRQISELELLIRDMRINRHPINPKKVNSTLPHAVTATAGSGATNGAYKIKVTQLATNAMNIGRATEDIDGWISNFISERGEDERTITFYTYDYGDSEKEIPPGMKARTFEIEEGDTIDSIIKKINAADDNIRAFYDEASGRLVMETKRAGKHNTTGKFGGYEIGFEPGESSFFTDLFGMRMGNEKGGQNAKFTYNDHLEFETKDNQYTLNGITFTFHDVTRGTDGQETNATLTVNTDIDTSVENIRKFVDKYNELIDRINGALSEPVYRDYPPLTEEQMEEMSERQIELWEEKAKSGLLRRDPILSSAMTTFRSTWSSVVNNDSAFRLLSEIGITTTESYMDGGKLEINEEILREKLEKDPESVRSLLLGRGEGDDGEGLLNRLEASLKNTMNRIEERAGKGSFTNNMYTMGRQLDSIEKRIEAFENRLKQVEDRYWRQFTEMERAISMMNNQSAMLMSFSANLYQ